MSFEFLLIYSFTVLIASITPGPSMILALNHGLKYGANRTIASAFGNLTATLIQASLSIAGLGAILMQSETTFNIIKYLGASYLIYLGIRSFLASTDLTIKINEEKHEKVTFKRLYWEAFLVTAGNPKAVIFFTALFPQFIDTQKNTPFQFIIILIILAIIAFCCMMLYGYFGQSLLKILQKAKVTKIFNRIVGTTLIGMGIGLASGKIEK
ncbi:MAG: LysE family translocator [Firmicutes bacterium]|nr:LysE family translocator [Bacillota bacterium]